MMKIFNSQNIITPQGLVSGNLQVNDNGYISQVNTKNYEEGIDYSEYYIIPGIIDTHNHGTMGYGLYGSVEDKEQEVIGYLKGLTTQGVTSVFPTADYEYFKDIVKVSKKNLSVSKVAGIHSEGPYLNRVGEQGVNEKPLEIDIDHVKDMIKDAQGYLKLVALAPELNNSQAMIDLLNEHNIKVAYAHSNMNYQEAMNAFNNGVSVATHTANVMSGIHHRDMGGLGACLLHPNVMCELIADGLHVSPEMMDLMLRVKDKSKWMLISDSTSASGAKPGKYTFGEFTINIDEEGFAKTDTGRLMGSTKPVLYGMKVLHKELGINRVDLSLMASTNPAKYYDLYDVGSLEIGKKAGFLVINKDFELMYTYINGECVYNYQDIENLFNPTF